MTLRARMPLGKAASKEIRMLLVDAIVTDSSSWFLGNIQFPPVNLGGRPAPSYRLTSVNHIVTNTASIFSDLARLVSSQHQKTDKKTP